MSENRHEEVQVTVLVPSAELAAGIIKTEDIAQAAQDYVTETVVAYRARRKAVTLGGRMTGVQIGDGNRQTNVY